MFLANFDWNLLCDELKLPRFKLSMKEEERIAKRIKQANRPKRVKKSTCTFYNKSYLLCS